MSHPVCPKCKSREVSSKPGYTLLINRCRSCDYLWKAEKPKEYLF